VGALSAVDRLLAQVRLGLHRVDPLRARQILEDGGLLIDIRPAAQRAEFGEVPGALIVERNNLEWRLDPGGSHRLPEAEDPDRPVVVICQEGYASSLAAASLIGVGRTAVTDLEGGFVAWKRARLPTTPGSRG
jgi:rhodanese-related sulfurtransferase